MLKTWVVNMDWNPHRMEFMKRQLDAFGIPFERFSGIVGADYFEKGGATLRKVFSPVRSLIALRKKMTAGQLRPLVQAVLRLAVAAQPFPGAAASEGHAHPVFPWQSDADGGDRRLPRTASEHVDEAGEVGKGTLGEMTC